MGLTRLFAMIAGVILLVPAPLRAQTAYQIQAMVRPGDAVGKGHAPSAWVPGADTAFYVDALNDSGQLIFNTMDPADGQRLIQSTAGKLSLIAAAGETAPDGVWPPSMSFYMPVSMNQNGDAAFTASVTDSSYGTFRWDFASHQTRPVALSGMRAGSHLILADGGGPTPVINDSGEIAFTAQVQDPSGDPPDFGVFFDRDAMLEPVAVPGQLLEDGSRVIWAGYPALDDAGRLVFLAQPSSRQDGQPYVWENGAMAPLLRVSPTPPAGRLLVGYDGVWVNNKNQNALLEAALHSLAGHYHGLYLVVDGRPIPVALPGQPMPGGGTLQSVQVGGVSFANEQGQHAFLGRLQDGATAAYLMGSDGKLSLILKSGTVTQLGRVVSVGPGGGGSQGIGLNSKGQVALTVRFAGGPGTVVLLSPPDP